MRAQASKPKRTKQTKKKLTIFISYAREDGELAKDIQSELKRILPFAAKIFLDQEIIQPGSDFGDVIDASLDAADILLILYTDQLKPSHSYTGYEVGYFSYSKDRRPYIVSGVERLIIPFCIGSRLPSTANYLEGVIIDADDVFSLAEEPSATHLAVPSPQQLDDTNPVLKLFQRIVQIAAKIAHLDADADALKYNIREAAGRLYRNIFSYLQTRKWLEDIPERKIIIRAAPPVPGADAVLAGADVELEGRSFDLFGISETPTRAFTWEQFLAKINPRELAAAWSEGIKIMVTAALKRDYDDNYHVVSNLRGDKAFRLFVSRVVTFYNGKVEIHIYVVEMKTRDYGDPVTTRLLKAISVGARFRFLILEAESPFTVENLSFPVVQMKPMVTELLAQMQLILRESRDARLEDPIFLRQIFGPEGHIVVQANMQVWNAVLSRLETAAHRLLCSDNPDPEAEKAPFLAALDEFAQKTAAMNRDFTSRALKALTNEIMPQAAGEADATGGTAIAEAKSRASAGGDGEEQTDAPIVTSEDKKRVTVPIAEIAPPPLKQAG